MQAIPVEVRGYLSTNDSLARYQLAQRYPDLNNTLNEPQTRTAVLNWLAGDEPWEKDNTHFTMNSLTYLRSKADPSEAQVIRPYLLHPHPDVRRAAYEFLLTLYFPDKNREALLQLLQNMLSDEQEAVRIGGARYIESTGLISELRSFLQRWQKTAKQQERADTESFQLIEQLLAA